MMPGKKVIGLGAMPLPDIGLIEQIHERARCFAVARVLEGHIEAGRGTQHMEQ